MHAGICIPPLFSSSIFSSKQFLMLNSKESVYSNIKRYKREVVVLLFGKNVKVSPLLFDVFERNIVFIFFSKV